MQYDYGNIWDMKCDALCIPTNGIVKANGEAVMGGTISGYETIINGIPSNWENIHVELSEE